MPRVTGAIPASWFDDPNIVFWYFLRMTWPGPVGTLRWTTHPADVFTTDIAIGDGTQDWQGKHVFIPGQFEQGEQNSLAVSDVTFGNADYSFTDMMNQFDFGVRGVPMELYAVAFTATMSGIPLAHQFIDRVNFFSGRGDRAEVGNAAVRVSMLPFSTPLNAKFPVRRFTPAYGFNWIPKDNLTIQFGTQIVALPSRAVTTPSETGSGGGGGGITIGDIGSGPSGRGPVIPVGRPRGTPTTPAGGRGGGRSTTTVVR